MSEFGFVCDMNLQLDVVLGQFVLLKDDDVVKTEATQETEGNIIEYVGEEFIDEDTNDGFEDENGIIHQEDDEEVEEKEQTSELMELGKLQS